MPTQSARTSTEPAPADLPVLRSRFAASAGELPWIEEARKVSPKDARELTKVFLDRLQELDEGTAAYSYTRNTLIEMNMSLVRFSARRFHARGREELEDILQVGTVGLIKAIDRFELSREVEFTTFAVPYIVGEMKRFFRDTTWSVHVPRRLQELRVALAKARDHLTAVHGAPPTVAELGAHLELSDDEIIEGLVAANGYTAGSLDVPAGETDDAQADTNRSFADTTGADDPGMELVENLQSLGPLLGRLDARDRSILQMRFGEELTQAEIGAELGYSQMHISRLLNSILTRLRAGLLTES